MDFFNNFDIKSVDENFVRDWPKYVNELTFFWIRWILEKETV